MRAQQGLAYFRSYWQCAERARVQDIRLAQGDAQRNMYQVTVLVRQLPDCAG